MSLDSPATKGCGSVWEAGEIHEVRWCHVSPRSVNSWICPGIRALIAWCWGLMCKQGTLIRLEEGARRKGPCLNSVGIAGQELVWLCGLRTRSSGWWKQRVGRIWGGLEPNAMDHEGTRDIWRLCVQLNWHVWDSKEISWHVLLITLVLTYSEMGRQLPWDRTSADSVESYWKSPWQKAFKYGVPQPSSWLRAKEGMRHG